MSQRNVSIWDSKEPRPWGFLGDVGYVINKYAVENGYSVVREIGGHGIGEDFHEEPWVGHIGKRGHGMLLVPGMVFTIQPMIAIWANRMSS